MFDSNDSKILFDDLMKKRSIDKKNTTLEEIFVLFKEFMKLEFDAAEDDILYEVYNGSSYSKYECDIEYNDSKVISFTRQFEIRDGVDYDHYEQLHIEVVLEMNKQIRKIKGLKWSFDYTNHDDFYDAIENNRDFKKAIGHSKVVDVISSFSWV